MNPIPITRDAWRAVATRAGVTVAEVEIECSDKREHRRRVEERLGRPPASSGPPWAEVVARDYRPWDREHIVIDTAGEPVEQIVGRLLAALPE